MRTVSTKIEPALFNQFANLNFKPHQALAEYVDNAIQSYLDHKNNPSFCDHHYKFKVDIDFEWEEAKDRKTYAKTITIKDNAAGISATKFASAFITAHKPDDNTGLNEYGMGMKTASCWFSRCWSLETHPYGERVVRSATFDVDKIIAESVEQIDVVEREDLNYARPYTKVTLTRLVEKNNITKAKLNKIKSSLASIYRRMLRSGELTLTVDGETLFFDSYDVLKKPYYKNYLGEDIEWIKSVSFNFGDKQIKGFIGLLESQSDKNNRLVLIRRGRVVVGEDEGNRLFVQALQGSPGSPRDKRVFGELEVKGFNATFNKNGLAEDEDLEFIIKHIAEEQLLVNGYKMLDQATKFTKRDYEAAKRNAKTSSTSGNSSATTGTSTGTAGTSAGTTGTSTGAGGTSTGTHISRGNAPVVPTVQPVPVELKDGHIITTKSFKHCGVNYLMELRIDQNISDMLLVGIPDGDGKIKALFNNKKCPLENPNKIPKEIGKMLCSLAISSFITKQNNGKAQDLIDFFNKYIEQYD